MMMPTPSSTLRADGLPPNKARPSRCQLDDDLRAIGELQRHLFPREVPQRDGWQFAVQCSVSPWPGGDYYDFLSLPDGRLVVLLADASGHGGPAAVMTAIVRVMLHSCPLTSGLERIPFCPLHGAAVQPPAIVLGHLNRLLVENSLEGNFVTAFYGVLNPGDGVMQFANAGHPAPRWWRAQTRRVEPVADVAGLPMGLEPTATYGHGRVLLEPGDALVLFSDGLTEARDQRGDMFSGNRLDVAIRDSADGDAEQLKACVLDRMHRFLGGVAPQDDVSVLVVQRARP
jgi:sigma-B regulation protein RsbU (phosphoserine phosphatase)